jgi:TIGR00341 family protein
MTMKNKSLWENIKGAFNALPNKENETEFIKQISNGVTFSGTNLWVLIFAIFIASLGLNVNSTAVIIGAMLISPLMGPIIGMGLSVGIDDFDLLKRSVRNYLLATVISVITATIYFTLSPLSEAQSELLARTSPTLYDVLIAIFGGAAGILALSTKDKGNVIPGVAIATALMPPLCTAGYGLAVGEISFFFGAFYLYFINTVFIALSTFIGVRLLRFQRRTFADAAALQRVRKYIIAIALITMIPATYMTTQIIRASIQDNNTQQFVKNELSLKGTHIISNKRNDESKTIRIVAVGEPIGEDTIKKAQENLKEYSLEGYKLVIIQGSQGNNTLRKEDLSGNSLADTKEQLITQSEQLSNLEKQLKKYWSYETLGKELSKEIKAICPQVNTISLSLVSEERTDTLATKNYVLALVGYKNALSTAEQQQLQRWLKTRSKADSLRLVLQPTTGK